MKNSAPTRSSSRTTGDILMIPGRAPTTTATTPEFGSRITCPRCLVATLEARWTAASIATDRSLVRRNARHWGDQRRLSVFLRAPRGPRGEQGSVDSLSESPNLSQHGVDQRLRELMGFKPQVEKLGVLGVVVVIFHLDAGVRKVVDPNIHSHLRCRLLYQAGELGHGELLRKLIEHPELAPFRRVQEGKLDAPQGVDDVEEASGLVPTSVECQRMVRHGLDAKPIEGRAEDIIVMEAGSEAVVEPGLLGLHSVDDALVQVGGPQ